MRLRRHLGLAGVVLALGILFVALDAEAVTCARGVVREGCVASGGAAVVRRPVAPVVRAPAAVVAPVARPVGRPVDRPPMVECERGVVREGCVAR